MDGTSSDGMTTSYGDIRLQNLDADHTGVSKFGDLYGRITNCNLLIARVTDATYLDEPRKIIIWPSPMAYELSTTLTCIVFMAVYL